MPPGTPQADYHIDSALVAGLLADQHPDLRQLPLVETESGWDNALFRLGDALAVRLPRRAAAAALIEHEQAWLPHLAPQLNLPVPVPLRSGVAGRGYPWRWSVVPWLSGRTADQEAPLATQAQPLAAFLRSLHQPAPADAPANPFRGVALATRAATVEERMQRLARTTNLITSRVMGIWQAALASPIDTTPTWLHGDLHPRNILVEQGRISGIIDWGDLAAGDCATDLAAIWMLLAEPAARAATLAAYGPLSEATLQRARGWAILFGVFLLDAGLIDDPRFAHIGEQTLRRVADHESKTQSV